MIATLQSLRFVFILLIFFSHFSYKNIHVLDAGGDCGVAFFFLLSGYVLTLGYGRRIAEGDFSYRAFLARRLHKVYPIHLLCLLFFVVVTKHALDLKVLLNVLLLQSWVPDSDYYFSCNAVAWFLSSILFCYLLFPVICRHMTRKWLVAILSAYAVIYALTPYEQVNAVLYVNPIVRCVDFSLGVALAKWWKPTRDLGFLEPWVVGILLLALLAYPYEDEKFRNAVMFWLVLLPMLAVFSQQTGVVSRLLLKPSMVWLGSLSMPFFMTHQMLINILVYKLPDMPAVVMLMLCFFTVLAVSWAVQIIFSRVLRSL